MHRFVPFWLGLLLALTAVLMSSSNAQGTGSSVVDVGPRSITHLVADPLRPYVYGLNRGASSSLVAFDAASGLIKREVSILSDPTDVALSPRGDSAYVIHFGRGKISRIDLETFVAPEVKDLAFTGDHSNALHYDIAAGPNGRLYITDGSWAPNVHIYDFPTGQELQVTNPGGEGAGDVAVSQNGAKAYIWRQYGWTAGVINTWITELDVSKNPAEVIQASDVYPGREPFDAQILLTADESRLFHKTRAHSVADLRQVLTTFPEDVYAISAHGELAVGTSKVFHGRTGAIIAPLPFPTTVSAFSADQKMLFLYSPSVHKLAVTPVSQFGEVSGPGLIPTPRVGEAVPVSLPALSWSTSPVALRYNLYLGVSSNTVAAATSSSAEFRGSFETNYLSLPPLSVLQNYFWRVDIVTISTTNTGPVWQFSTAPILVMPRQISARAVSGSAPAKVLISVQTNGVSAEWSASEDAAWLKLGQTNGAASAGVEAEFSVSGLNPGIYTNVITFRAGDFTFTIPVEFEIITAAFTKMVADIERPYIYAIQPPASGRSGASICVINTETELVERTIAIGVNPIDLDIHYGERRLYLADWGSPTTPVLDLETFQVLPPFTFGNDVYRINAGRPGRVLTEGADQWVDTLIWDTLTGAQVKRQWGIRAGDGEVDPTGRFYYHCDDNISNAHITKYDVSQDEFTVLATSLEHPYGSRSLIMSADGSRLFWRGYIYDADLRELGFLGEEVHSTSFRGELAVAGTNIFNTASGAVLHRLPFSGAVSAFSGDQQKLFVFNTDAKNLEVVRLSEVLNVPSPEVLPAPANGAVITLPFSGRLKWTTSPVAAGYQVYFGRDSNAVAQATPNSPLYLGQTSSPEVPLPMSLSPDDVLYWRVDIVGFFNMKKGPVWNFTVFPLRVNPSVSLFTVAGSPSPIGRVRIIGVPTNQWTARLDSTNMSLSATNGSGSAELLVSPPALEAPGILTNLLTLTSAGIEFQVPVRLEAFRMSLSRLMADRERPYIYGLHPGGGQFEDAFVVLINTQTDRIEQAIPVGSNPTDFTINYFEDRMYVSNWRKNKTVVLDLSTMTELPGLSLGTDVFKINAGRAGRIYAEGNDQWIQLSIIDSLTGAQVRGISVREGDGEGDPSGVFYYHCDNNSSGATLQKYRVDLDSLDLVASTRNIGFGSRNLVMSGDGSRLFWMGSMFDADLKELAVLGQEIHASSPDGRIALGLSAAINTVDREIAYQFPFATAVQAVSSDGGKIYRFDTEKKELVVSPFAQISNLAPRAKSLVVEINEDSDARIELEAEDPEGDPIRFFVVPAPLQGSLELTGADSSIVVYRPLTNFSGQATFSYYAADLWRTSAVALVTVNVLPINDPPILKAGAFNILSGIRASLFVAASDPEGEAVSISVGEPPRHGSLEQAGSVFYYTSDAKYVGSDSFTVQARDAGGLTSSATFSLNVGEPVCASVAEGLLYDWSWNGNGHDSAGGAEFRAATNFTAGIVSEALDFAASPGELTSVGASPVDLPHGFAIEAWVRRGQNPGKTPLITWGDIVTISLEGGKYLAELRNPDSTNVATPELGTNNNHFEHVAFVYDVQDTSAAWYVNGQLVTSQSITGATWTTGSIVLAAGGGFRGALDELAFFERPLSPAEVSAIYLAGPEGKCSLAPHPPAVLGEWREGTAVEGNFGKLEARLAGSAPFSLQWHKDGVAIPGATNHALEIPSVAPSDAGVYSLSASNREGSTHNFVQKLNVARSSLLNGSFEQGLTGWIVNDVPAPYNAVRSRGPGYTPSAQFFRTAPTAGSLVLAHGWDGQGPGTIIVRRVLTVPRGSPTLTFDYRAGWDTRLALYPREFYVFIEPLAGDRSASWHSVLSVPPAQQVRDSGARSATVDLSAYEGHQVELSFNWEVPEAFKAPSFFQLDNVAFKGSGGPVIRFATRLVTRSFAVAEGRPFNLTATVEGGGPITNVWFKGDTAVTLGHSLSFSAVGASDGGVYRLVSSNSSGSKSSPPILIEVVPPGGLGASRVDDALIWTPVAWLPGEAEVQVSSDLFSWSPAGSRVLITPDGIATLMNPGEARTFYRVIVK